MSHIYDVKDEFFLHVLLKKIFLLYKLADFQL